MEDPSPIKRPGLALAAVTIVGALLVGYGVFHERFTAGDTVANGAQAKPETPQSQQRPAFALPDLNGVKQSIDQWNGKVVAVNFWATWCGPCREEIPSFNELQQRYGKQGVQFVGVAIDDAEAVRHFIKTTPIDYPVLMGEDEGFDIAQRYGNDLGILPYTVLIDRQGRIAHVQFGLMSRSEAEKALQPLL